MKINRQLQIKIMKECFTNIDIRIIDDFLKFKSVILLLDSAVLFSNYRDFYNLRKLFLNSFL